MRKCISPTQQKTITTTTSTTSSTTRTTNTSTITIVHKKCTNNQISIKD